MAYFPMFVNIEDRPCLVAGGGRIAYRKVRLLLEFGAAVTVIAPEVCEELRRLAADGEIEVILRHAELSDCDGKTLVVTATDDEAVNRSFSEYCSSRNIPINVVDRKELCSFILPSIVREQELVAAFSSSGLSPVLTQYLKAKEQEILTPYLGEVNALLGRWRKPVQEQFATEAERREVFSEIMERAIDSGMLPEDEEIEALIRSRKEEAGE